MTHVLLVEDNLALLDGIALDLEMRGYQISKATNGVEALELMGKLDTLPDIIISDIAMPDMDGYQFLEKIHEKPEWDAIPFLFLTAFGSPNAVRMGKELGVDDYLVKPFQPDDLIVAMENKLRRVKLFRQDAERRIDSTRQELLNMIAHELRTPLTSIYGGAEMLAESMETISDETSRVMLELVRGGARRVNRLVNQMLNVLQIDSGQMAQLYEMRALPCDLQALVHQAQRVLENNWVGKKPDVTVDLDLPAETLWVMGVQDSLVTIIAEALRNGMIFAPAQSFVTLRLWREGDKAVLMVQDNGMGIAPADQPRIWERFQQIDRTEHEQQGVGLGLALVNEIARIHKGRAWVESDTGKGTRLYISLPLAPADKVE